MTELLESVEVLVEVIPSSVVYKKEKLLEEKRV